MPARPARRLSDPVKEMRALCGLDSRALREFARVTAHCSLAFGASGIAYSLARTADLLRDSGLLLAADAWIAAAERRASSKRAFLSPAQRRAVGSGSLAFAEPGLFYAKSIVCSLMGNRAGVESAARQFLILAKSRLSRVADLHRGGLGLALAAKHLTSCVSSTGIQSELSNLSRRYVRLAWAKTGTDIQPNQLLGFAHGMAGQVFATYECGDRKTGSRVVQQLRETAIPFRKAMLWPVRAGSREVWAGWCNGLAGHLLMWTKLWRDSQDKEDREMLERLAWGVWKYRMPLGNLCCGAPGQAIPLASFSSTTGDHHQNRKTRDWLHSLRPRWPSAARPESLFGGKLGLLLARIECEYAAPPQFPVYQQDCLAALQPLKN